MVRLTDCPEMTLGVYLGPKTTTQQQQKLSHCQKTSYTNIKVMGILSEEVPVTLLLLPPFAVESSLRFISYFLGI